MTDTPEFEELIERVYTEITQDEIKQIVRDSDSRDDAIKQLDNKFRDNFFDKPAARGAPVNPGTNWDDEMSQFSDNPKLSTLVAYKIYDKEHKGTTERILERRKEKETERRRELVRRTASQRLLDTLFG